MLERRRVPSRPSIRVERSLSIKYNTPLVAGIDEAGRGPLAGPVVAAAVIFPLDGRRPAGLGDSKQLTARARERLFPRIQRAALAWGIGVATNHEIDLLNILEATRLAAARALAALSIQPDVLLTDALELPKERRPVYALIKGDAISASVAAASILAKVERDRLMDLYATEFPEYGWTANRGYPTEDHYAAIEAHGPCVLHRLTFRGVGFFPVDPRRSPTYNSLRDRLAAAPPGEAPETIRLELERRREALPPTDLADLERLLKEFQSTG